MAKVVFVHGVGKQYLSEDSLARDVVPELLGGVRLTGAPVPPPEDVGIAFYGDIFRPRGGRAGLEEPLDAVDVESDEEFALLMEWWARAAATDPAVPGPDAAGGRGTVGWAGSQLLRIDRVRAALDALTGAQFLTGVLDRLLVSDLKQMAGYLTDDTIRERAKARLAARITPDTRVVLAHSLGSVVAYETLCDPELNADWDVHMLVTLGSPWACAVWSCRDCARSRRRADWGAGRWRCGGGPISPMPRTSWPSSVSCVRPSATA